MADKLAATFGPQWGELQQVREINANLPFADPIAPVIQWANTDFPLVAGRWLVAERFWSKRTHRVLPNPWDVLS
jgi:hypothetical protein